LWRASLPALVTAPEYHLSGEVDSFQAIPKHVQQHQVDLILLDAGLEQLNGPSGLRELSIIAPNAKVVVIVEGDARTGLSDWLNAGARGCVPRAATFAQMQIAMKAVVAGGVYAPISLREQIKKLQPASSGRQQTGRFPALTERQRQIMTLVVEGWDTNAIARHLDIGKSTVRIHLLAIYRSAVAHSRARTVGGSVGLPAPDRLSGLPALG
jgi:DNA-binding NarL/FixJ family response regulator